MRQILSFILLLTFSIMSSSGSFAQKGKQDSKDKIVMPQFPGGEEALHKFIISELNFPPEARINKESGEVLVAFSVGMDGYISGVRVVRSVSKSLDAEAMRVISKMPSWVPGKKNGRPVRAEMTIPINFKLLFGNKYVNESDDYENVRDEKFSY